METWNYVEYAAWALSAVFGLYMVIGMVVTAIVVVGVAALVLWVMVTLEL